ncbi:hypothetical protein ACHAWO_011836 [Cyclotella atomus]|uniref:shikimate kinase n=1 Tax=Cyclotella atomus TaxID=382360 RepID=A0ABD3PKB7_9STRA
MNSPSPLQLLLALIALAIPSSSFAPIRSRHALVAHHQQHQSTLTTLQAGGFEWEDPTSEYADPGIENPYKNPSLKSSSENSDDSSSGDLKIDAARLLSPRLKGCNIYLIGLMGSGKSAIGDTLARRMATYNFLDMDSILERAAGMSIPSIFETEGEEAFRHAEATVLDSVHAHIRCVISTGGGVVLRNQNWSKLQTGIVVYLKCSPEVIIQRIEGTDRPLLQTSNPLETLKNIYEERREKYEQADVTVEIGKEMDVSKACEEVVKAVHEFIDENPPAYKTAKMKAQADGLDWVN